MDRIIFILAFLLVGFQIVPQWACAGCGGSKAMTAHVPTKERLASMHENDELLCYESRSDSVIASDGVSELQLGDEMKNRGCSPKNSFRSDSVTDHLSKGRSTSRIEEDREKKSLRSMRVRFTDASSDES